jgi:hypothetical protein
MGERRIGGGREVLGLGIFWFAEEVVEGGWVECGG